MNDISRRAISVLKALQELDDGGYIHVDVTQSSYNEENHLEVESLVTEKGKQLLDKFDTLENSKWI